MKLLDIQSLDIVEYLGSQVPPYAVLSHTWGTKRVSISAPPFTVPSTLAGPLRQKLRGACDVAIGWGIQHLWVDFLCIDASSTAELDEAVNGSLQRLSNSAVCIAYLEDVPPNDRHFNNEQWTQCGYWKRAWVLQELIFPPKVEIFDSAWNHCGSKLSPELLPVVSQVTGIPESVLVDSGALSEISIARRISWFADKSSTRAEDESYSIAAIAGVTMTVRYGEGAERAFRRLQEEILRDTSDGSIFAWRSRDGQLCRGLLAKSTSEFRHFADSTEPICQRPWTFDGKVSFSNRGIQIESLMLQHGSGVVLDIGQPDSGSTDKVGIYLRKWNGIYVRVNPTSEIKISGDSHLETIYIHRDVECRVSTEISQALNRTEHGGRGYDEAPSKRPRSSALSADVSASNPSTGQSWLASSCEYRPGTTSSSKRRRITRNHNTSNDDQTRSNDQNPYHLPDDIPTSEVKEQATSFACPFFRLDSLRYADCLSFKLQRIQDVKQHIQRRHSRTAFSCPICQEWFTTSHERDGHIRSRNCQHQAGEQARVISPEMQMLLRKRVDRKLSPENQWYRIWDTLFSGEARPSKPFRGNTIEESLQITRDFWEKNGGDIAQSLQQEEAPRAQKGDDDKPFTKLSDKLEFNFQKKTSGRSHQQISDAETGMPQTIAAATGSSSGQHRISNPGPTTTTAKGFNLSHIGQAVPIDESNSLGHLFLSDEFLSCDGWDNGVGNIDTNNA